MSRLIAFSCFLLLGGCTAPPPPAEPPQLVRTLTIAPLSAASEHTFSGEVKARRESRLSFRVGGKILSRSVEVGAEVAAGQPLARLDATDLALAARAADARLAAAQTALEEARANLSRFTALRDKNFISEAELERHRAHHAAMSAALESAQSEARFARNQLDYAALTAPAAGVVTAIDAEAGQVVAAGTPVMTLAQAGEREIALFVPEDKLELLRAAPVLQVSLWARPHESWSGRVREIAPAADPLTRTYAARIAVSGAPLPLGMSATVKLKTAADARIRLPLSALMNDAAGSAVWRVDAKTQTVRRAPVHVGALDGNAVWIEQGVNPGEVVVTAGAHLLHEGQAVRALSASVSP